MLRWLDLPESSIQVRKYEWRKKVFKGKEEVGEETDPILTPPHLEYKNKFLTKYK